MDGDAADGDGEEEGVARMPGGGGADSDNTRVENLILGRLDSIEGKLDTAISAMRTEMTAGDERRLSKDVFEQYQVAINTRIERLEGSPMKVLAWLGFACGSVGGPLLNVALFIITKH